MTPNNVKCMEEEKTLQAMLRVLGNISEKLDRISQTENLILEYLNKPKTEKLNELMPIDVDALLRLPDHLRRSVQTLMELKCATAEDISAQTGRTRAAESDYMNQLMKMGYVKKERRGRTVFFRVE